MQGAHLSTQFIRERPHCPAQFIDLAVDVLSCRRKLSTDFVAELHHLRFERRHASWYGAERLHLVL